MAETAKVAFRNGVVARANARDAEGSDAMGRAARPPTIPNQPAAQTVR